MSEIFRDKNLSKRVVHILGHDPNDGAGYTPEDLQKLDAYNVFQRGARGPWTPKPDDPAFLEVFQEMERLQGELTALHEKIKGMPVRRGWKEGFRGVLENFDTFLKSWRRAFL